MKTFIIGATEYQPLSHPEINGESYVLAKPIRKIRNGQWRRIYGRKPVLIKLSELEEYQKQ